jgi:Trk-type K+ transport system membrane component
MAVEIFTKFNDPVIKVQKSLFLFVLHVRERILKNYSSHPRFHLFFLFFCVILKIVLLLMVDLYFPMGAVPQAYIRKE